MIMTSTIFVLFITIVRVVYIEIEEFIYGVECIVDEESL